MDDVQICNLALSFFGQEKINDLSETAAETDENVAKCLTYFDQAKKEVLEAHPWSFSRKRAVLTREVATPAFDWDYQHTLPTDCIRVLEVREGTEATASGASDTYEADLDEYEIANGKILSDATLVAIRYTADETVEDWSAHAAIALARKLAQYLAGPITGDPARADYHRSIYQEEALPMAQHYDAVQDQSNDNHPLEDRLNNSLLVRRRGQAAASTRFYEQE